MIPFLLKNLRKLNKLSLRPVTGKFAFLWILLLLLPGLFWLFSCKEGPEVGADEFRITGTLKNTRGELVRLQWLSVDSLSTLDSVIIDNKGTFSFKGDLKEPGFYLIGTGPDNFITLLVAPGEDISIEGDALQIASDYAVSGSPGSQLILDLNRHTRRNYMRSDSLMQLLKENQSNPRYDSIKQRIDSSYTDIYNDQKHFLKTFITQHSGSLASLIAIYQVFGRIRMINEREDAALFEKLDQDLWAKYPGNAYVVELHARVENLKKDRAEREAREKKLDTGQVAPAIQLRNPAGVSVTLSSYRGNVVLLHFWASWSPESLSHIALYRNLQKKYGPKGFTIFSISLDKDRQTWEDAIREHKMYWPQGSDLQEWNCPLVKTYNINELPVIFLIDREGRIVLKRPDDQTLVNQLARLFKF